MAAVAFGMVMLAPLAVKPFGPTQAYVLPPLAVKVRVIPAQILGLPLMVIVGKGLIVNVTRMLALMQLGVAVLRDRA